MGSKVLRMKKLRIKLVKKTAKLWMTTKKHLKRTLMASRRRLKEYALLSLQSCTKMVELLRVCQEVCLVECLEECLLACLVMLAMLKVVQDQQLKKSIKSDLLEICMQPVNSYAHWIFGP